MSEAEGVYEIRVEGLQLWGRHGVFEEERSEGRHFQIDLAVEIEPSAPLCDAIESTLDYRKLAEAALAVAQGPSVRLVETLADAIALRCLEFPSARRAEVTVRKRATGVPGSPPWVGARVVRRRG